MHLVQLPQECSTSRKSHTHHRHPRHHQHHPGRDIGYTCRETSRTAGSYPDVGSLVHCAKNTTQLIQHPTFDHPEKATQLNWKPGPWISMCLIYIHRHDHKMMNLPGMSPRMISFWTTWYQCLLSDSICWKETKILMCSLSNSIMEEKIILF